MPKEVTHWLVAEGMAKALARSIPGESAVRYPADRSFGAIYPDILFYLPGGGEEVTLAHRYHGVDGEDTYNLIRWAVSRITEPNRPCPWWSFVVGLISHIVADQVFHPMVYYFTGNDESRDEGDRIQAIIDHRKWECLIDLHLVGRRNLRTKKLEDMVSSLELPMSEILTLDPRATDLFPRALKYFVRLQKMFSQPILLWCLGIVQPLLPTYLQGISALFYRRDLDQFLPYMAETLIYYHPITGDKEEVTVKQLLDRAINRGKEMVAEVAQAWEKRAPVLPERGYSLSFGMDGNPRYFSPHPVFTLRSVSALKRG